MLIYEQTCAAEKRRRRKKGELADPELERQRALRRAVEDYLRAKTKTEALKVEAEMLKERIDSLGKADVFMRRNMPRTPAGDLVCTCETGQQAERLALYMNDQYRMTLEEAIDYAKSQGFNKEE